MHARPGQLDLAVERLRAGGVVAFPTETVYGLGADALSDGAVRRVFELKGRPATNPLIVHVADEGMARRVVAGWTDEAHALADAFWPGPLTIVLARADVVPDAVTAGGPTVGVRCPDHELALALLETFGAPLVGPSANRSGHVSPTTADHVRAEFDEADVLVLDGGPCRAGIESTVVDLSTTPARVLRPGVIAARAIERVIGRPVDTPRVVAAADAPARSPGTRARHYAPRTPAVLFDPDDWPAPLERAGGRVCVLARTPLPIDDDQACEVIAMPRSPEAYAAARYDALRRADATGPSLIAIERPPSAGDTPDETSLWASIADRLARATTPDDAP